MNEEEITLYRKALDEIKKIRLENISLKEEKLKSDQEKLNLEKELLELREIAYKDELTNLSNRRVIKGNEHDYAAVVIGDIDFFKKVNDTYGHDMGDEVLKKVAEILKKNVRDNDLAIRYGGEEFLILLKKCSEKNAIAKADKIRKNIETAGFNFPLTMSFGVAVSNGNEPLQVTITEADKALYYSKENGRNQVNCYSKLPKDKQLIKND